jgi:hypothetical protein
MQSTALSMRSCDSLLLPSYMSCSCVPCCICPDLFARTPFWSNGWIWQLASTSMLSNIDLLTQGYWVFNYLLLMQIFINYPRLKSLESTWSRLQAAPSRAKSGCSTWLDSTWKSTSESTSTTWVSSHGNISHIFRCLGIPSCRDWLPGLGPIRGAKSDTEPYYCKNKLWIAGFWWVSEAKGDVAGSQQIYKRPSLDKVTVRHAALHHHSE